MANPMHYQDDQTTSPPLFLHFPFWFPLPLCCTLPTSLVRACCYSQTTPSFQTSEQLRQGMQTSLQPWQDCKGGLAMSQTPHYPKAAHRTGLHINISSFKTAFSTTRAASSSLLPPSPYLEDSAAIPRLSPSRTLRRGPNSVPHLPVLQVARPSYSSGGICQELQYLCQKQGGAPCSLRPPVSPRNPYQALIKRFPGLDNGSSSQPLP